MRLIHVLTTLAAGLMLITVSCGRSGAAENKRTDAVCEDC